MKDNNDVFISNETINNILNYSVPDKFRCIEQIHDLEAFEVLTNINPLIKGYSKIKDALHPQNIDTLKTLKKYTKKDGHIVDYSKSSSGRGRYTPSNKNKNDYASFQGLYNRVRRILCNGELIGVDISNAHIEIIKNICKILNLPNDNYSVLNEYCENRNKIFDDGMKAFNCNRETIKKFFIIHLFGVII